MWTPPEPPRTAFDSEPLDYDAIGAAIIAMETSDGGGA